MECIDICKKNKSKGQFLDPGSKFFTKLLAHYQIFSRSNFLIRKERINFETVMHIVKRLSKFKYRL